jgi:hypothetical protein
MGYVFEIIFMCFFPFLSLWLSPYSAKHIDLPANMFVILQKKYKENAKNTRKMYSFGHTK